MRSIVENLIDGPDVYRSTSALDCELKNPVSERALVFALSRLRCPTKKRWRAHNFCFRMNKKINSVMQLATAASLQALEE